MPVSIPMVTIQKKEELHKENSFTYFYLCEIKYRKSNNLNLNLFILCFSFKNSNNFSKHTLVILKLFKFQYIMSPATLFLLLKNSYLIYKTYFLF